jgi:hypothetical protein
MKEADYMQEYKRRLERTRVKAPPALKRRLREAIKAEDQPDPTRSKVVWDEDGHLKRVKVYADVDPYAVDRGEG